MTTVHKTSCSKGRFEVSLCEAFLGYKWMEICHIFLWENRDKIFLNRVSLETTHHVHTYTQWQSFLYCKNQRLCILGSLIIINFWMKLSWVKKKKHILLQPLFSQCFLEASIGQKFYAPKSSPNLKGRDIIFFKKMQLS